MAPKALRPVGKSGCFASRRRASVSDEALRGWSRGGFVQLMGAFGVRAKISSMDGHPDGCALDPYVVAQVRTSGLPAPANYVDPTPRPLPSWGKRGSRLSQRRRMFRAFCGAGDRHPFGRQGGRHIRVLGGDVFLAQACPRGGLPCSASPMCGPFSSRSDSYRRGIVCEPNDVETRLSRAS